LAALNGGPSTNTLDPTTWKYYLNISGQYHPRDKQMTIVSIDTRETIVFSPANLLIHTATARQYAFGTRQYTDLVSRYPDQEMLILGILYPVDINTAIAAPDGKILGFPSGLVEANEYSLINKLQNWINGFKQRCIVKAFTLTDTLYTATMLGIMYTKLVEAIIAYRLEACKTNEAHSFHVRQYLSSHGIADDSLDLLTIKQALWFYRNINYLERNAGKREIFDWLVEHIMSERQLPIAEFTMHHDLTDQPDNIYPTVTFRKKPINLGYSPDLSDNLTLEEMLTKEDPLARDNLRFKEDLAVGALESLENSLSNTVMTKVLESSVIDYTDSSPYTLPDILIDHWIFLASSDTYTAYINVTNPKNGEQIPLTVKEAFVLYWYAYCKTIGLTLLTIPPIFAKRVQRIIDRDVLLADMVSIVDPKLVPRSVAVQALSMQPVISQIYSTDAFYNLCVDICAAAQMQRSLIAYQEHYVARGMVHGMVSRIYSDNVCYMDGPGKTYDIWFETRNLTLTDLTDANWQTLSDTILGQATGADLHKTTTLKQLQTAMVNMLSQLASYSVQIIPTINNSAIHKTDWPVVRVGNMGLSTTELEFIPLEVGVLDVGLSTKQKAAIALAGGKALGVDGVKQKSSIKLRFNVKPTSGKHRLHMLEYMPLNPIFPREGTAPTGLPLNGLITTTVLSGLNWVPNNDPSLANLLPINTLDGLNY
jgi:hypothetical protein